jgi:hypothetical protein
MGDVIDLPVELPPFTEDMRAAIRECRFKTVNHARTTAIVYDADRARMEATGLQFTAWRRAPMSEPSLWDHEGRSGDPRVIEFVAGLAS